PRSPHLELDGVAELVLPGRRAELADDRRQPPALEPMEYGRPQPEQVADLLRHELKDLLRRGIAYGERRHPAPRRLPLGPPPELRLVLPFLGEVADDRDHLVRPARHDPRLDAAGEAADLELVLDGTHPARLERALDAGQPGVRCSCR